jgi:hypothetical protein
MTQSRPHYRAPTGCCFFVRSQAWSSAHVTKYPLHVYCHWRSLYREVAKAGESTSSDGIPGTGALQYSRISPVSRIVPENLLSAANPSPLWDKAGQTEATKEQQAFLVKKPTLAML